MRILFFSHYFPPEVNAPATRTFEHCRRWAARPGVEVTVITNHPNHPKGRLFAGWRNRWLTRQSTAGFQVLRVKTFLAANAGVLRRTLNYLFYVPASLVACLAAKRPSVVVATSPQFFCALAGWLASCLWRRPFVFELRDLWPDSIAAVGAIRAGLALRAVEALELFLYRRAAAIVAVTSAYKDNLVSRGIDPTKIMVVTNGVDLTEFPPQEAARAKAALPRARGKFVVSYLGTMGMAHNVEGILDAAALLQEQRDILFLLVGEGARRGRVEAKLREMGLPNLLLLPGVPRREIAAYYALSDLILVTLHGKPLFKTVLPSKIFEAMAMERPILTSVDGLCRRLLEQAGAGRFAAPDDPAALARAILELKADEAARESLGRAGRGLVEREYDRDLLAERMLAVLQKAAAGPGK